MFDDVVRAMQGLQAGDKMVIQFTKSPKGALPQFMQSVAPQGAPSAPLGPSAAPTTPPDEMQERAALMSRMGDMQ